MTRCSRWVDGAEQALGAAALRARDGRRLLRRMVAPARTVDAESGPRGGAARAWRWATRSPSWARSTAAERCRRAACTSAGGRRAGAGDGHDAVVRALPPRRRSAGWSAPAVVSATSCSPRSPGRCARPGRALRRPAAARGAGAPWFEAASGSYGDAVLSALGRRRPGPRRAGRRPRIRRLARRRRHPRFQPSGGVGGGAGRHRRRARRASGRPVATRRLAAVLDAVDHRAVRDALRAALAPTELPPTGSPGRRRAAPRPRRAGAGRVVRAAQRRRRHRALGTAVESGGGDRTAVAVTGALFGAIHGTAALPARSDVGRGCAGLRRARRPHHRSAGRPRSSDRSGADIWFLLDRSGSMQSIARDVVVGFDRFFAEQRQVAWRRHRHGRPVRRPRPARRHRRRPAARRGALDRRPLRAAWHAPRCTTPSASCSTGSSATAATTPTSSSSS